MGTEIINKTKQQTKPVQINTRTVAKASGGVATKVENLLGGGDNSILLIFKKYPFIKNIDGKIIAEFSPEIKKRKTSLVMFLQEVSKASYYIKDLTKNINLNDIFDKEIGESETIILGTGYGEIGDDEAYLIASLGAGKETRTYHFNKFVDAGVKLGTDIDKFVSNLYRQGIFYGYDYEAINKGFEYLRGRVMLTNSIIQIAESSKAINGVNSKLLGVSPKINTDTRSKDLLAFGLDTQRQIDTKTYINTTFDVQKGEILQVKIPHKKGKHGFKVTGEVIKANEGIDKENLEEKFLEGFEIINMSGKKFVEYLISDDKNYEAGKVAEIFADILYIESPEIRRLINKVVIDNFGKNGERVVNALLKKLNIAPESIINVDVIKAAIDGTYQAKDKTQKSFVILETLEKTIIDHHSGNIHKILPNKEFIVTGEEDKDIKGLIKGIEKGWKITGEYKKLTITGNIYGDIEVSGNTEIVLKGNMSGGSKIIHTGTGHITIEGMISADALVDARFSEINISNLENGTVMAGKLQINSLSNGTIFAKEIIIENIKNRENSKLNIIGEKIDVKNLENRGSCKSVLLCEKLSIDDLMKMKNATNNEIKLEDKQILEILNSPELIQYYDKLIPYIHDFAKLNQLIGSLIKSREIIVEGIKNQLNGIENPKELDDRIAIQITNSKVQGTDSLKKNRLRNRNVRLIHKLKQHLINLEDHIKRITEKKMALEEMSGNISKSTISVKNYLGGNSMELYTYDYPSKTGDIYVDISNDELSALLTGTRNQDDSYRKLQGILTKSNFIWSATNLS